MTYTRILRLLIYRVKSIFLLIILIGGISATLYSQDRYLMFERLTTDDGLTHNTSTAIIQDRNGFIWIGTQKGLNIYNGYEFKHYQREAGNHDSISGNFIICLLQDSDGYIWAGTYGQGLNRINPSTGDIKHYHSDKNRPDSLSNDVVLSLYEHDDGNIWVGTQNGLNIINPENDKISKPYQKANQNNENNSFLSKQVIYDIYKDSEGFIWIGTRKGVNKIHPDTGIIKYYQHEPDESNTISGNIVRCIWEDHDGSMWFGTNNNGLNHFDKETELFTHYKHIPGDDTSLSHDYVRKVITDDLNQLWIATWGGGLNLFQRDKGTFIRYRYMTGDDTSISSDDVFDIYQDRDGNIWVSTITGGVNLFQNSPYLVYRNKPNQDNSLSSNTVKTVYQDDEGILWIGTNKGLNKYNPIKDQYTVYTNIEGDDTSISGNYIQTIYDSKDGYLWIGTNTRGLNRFDKEKEVFTHYQHRMDDPNSISNNNITSICSSDGRYLWIGTERGGLNRFDRREATFKSYMPEKNNPTSISHDWISDIMSGGNGYLWVSTLGGGLNKFNIRDETFKQYYYNPNDKGSLSNNTILGIGKDDYGNLWVGTVEGLNQYVEERDSFIRYATYNTKLIDNTIRGISSDGMGNIWFGTNKGISRLTIASGEVTNYDVSKAYPSSTTQSVSYWDEDTGYLFVCSLNGLIKFDPAEVKDRVYQPEVYITNITTENKPIELDKPFEKLDRLNLDWDNNSFSFTFAGLEYAAPEHIIYQYRLKGFDKGWIETEAGHRYARYTNLNGGSYLLQIRARHYESDWASEDKWVSLILKVETPPYLTWWAISIYSIGLLGLVLGITVYIKRGQLKKVEKQDEELRRQKEDAERQRILNEKLKELDKFKDNFLANTSHELKTPINGIIGIIDSMIDGATGELTEEQVYNLSLVASSGRRLNNLVRNLLDLSRIKDTGIKLNKTPVDIKTVTDTVILFINPMIKRKDLQLINKIDPDIPFVFGDEERIQQIMYNLIGNAVKFTTEGEITITANLSDEYVRVNVSDTGMGIPDDDIDYIFQSSIQMKDSSKQGYTGSGLGLSITKELIEMHGGEINVNSTVGEGSRFMFTLPVCKDVASDKKVKPDLSYTYPVEEGLLTGSEDENGRSGDKSSILIIDDEMLNRRILRNYLEHRGYRVSEAVNTEDALSSIELDKPDLILLDLMLPGTSGYDLCQTIRESYTSLELPIIIVTIKDKQDDVNRGLDLGANDYVTKPVDKKELLFRVNNAILSKKTIEELNQLKKKLEKDVTVKIEESKKADEDLHLFNMKLDESQNKLIRLNKSLQESEDRLKLILGAVADGIWDYDIEARKVKFYSEYDYLNRMNFIFDEISIDSFDWDKYVHPDDIEPLFEGMRKHISGETERFAVDFRIHTSYKDWHWISAKGKVVKRDEDNNPTQIIGVFIDINKSKQAEEALIDSKNKLKFAQELSHTGNWELDVATNEVNWSEETYRIYGMDPEKDAPSLEKIVEIIHPDDREIIKGIFSDIPQSIDDMKDVHFRIIREDGEVRHLKTVIKVIKDNKGKITKLSGVLLDITDLKKAEELIIRNEEKLKTALDAASQGVWEWKINENKFFWNERWDHLLGITDHSFDKDPKKLLEMVHPEDKEYIKDSLNLLTNNKDEIMKCECRFITNAGRTIWVLVMGKVFERDSQGNPTRMIGTISDITDQKTASQKLKNSLLEKEVLLKEIHHRVKNNLQIISSLINLQSRYVEDEDILNIFLESRIRIQSMALIHENLYQSESLAKINFYSYVKTLTSYLFHSYELDNNVKYKINVEEDISLNINTAVPCGLIINELVSNAFKYAFPEGEEGMVNIEFKSKPKEYYILRVSDNGIGLPEDIKPENSASLGLNLVRILVNQLDGEIDIVRDNGTSFEIRFMEVDEF
jgi:two-component system, sensor histidine kinase ChiS